MNIDMRDLCGDGMSADQIASKLGLPPTVVRQIERDGLVKMGIGMTLVELLGKAHGNRVLLTLRDRPLHAWRRALLEARVAAMGGRR